MEVGSEGNTIRLVEPRTPSFANRKIAIGSPPLRGGTRTHTTLPS